MPRRLFEFDGGPGDRHTVLLDDGRWYGWENLFTNLPLEYRQREIARLMFVAADGRTAEYDIYKITELPDGVLRAAAVPQPDEFVG